MFVKWNLLVFGLGLAVEGEVERRYGHKEDKPRILDRRTFRTTHVTVSLGPGKKTSSHLSQVDPRTVNQWTDISGRSEY